MSSQHIRHVPALKHTRMFQYTSCAQDTGDFLKPPNIPLAIRGSVIQLGDRNNKFAIYLGRCCAYSFTQTHTMLLKKKEKKKVNCKLNHYNLCRRVVDERRSMLGSAGYRMQCTRPPRLSSFLQRSNPTRLDSTQRRSRGGFKEISLPTRRGLPSSSTIMSSS